LWLGILSGIVAAVLVANGADLGTEEVPGMMALLLLIFIVAITLMIRTPRPRQ